MNLLTRLSNSAIEGDVRCPEKLKGLGSPFSKLQNVISKWTRASGTPCQADAFELVLEIESIIELCQGDVHRILCIWQSTISEWTKAGRGLCPADAALFFRDITYLKSCLESPKLNLLTRLSNSAIEGDVRCPEKLKGLGSPFSKLQNVISKWTRASGTPCQADAFELVLEIESIIELCQGDVHRILCIWQSTISEWTKAGRGLCPADAALFFRDITYLKSCLESLNLK